MYYEALRVLSGHGHAVIQKRDREVVRAFAEWSDKYGHSHIYQTDVEYFIREQLGGDTK